MKLQMLAVASAGVVLGIAAALIVRHQNVLLFDTADSPIDIAGGSIRAYTDQTLVKVSDTEYYATYAATTNLKQIHTSGIKGITSPVTTQDGWVITISNKGKHGNEKEGAVTICSDESCSSSLDSNYRVYLFTRKTDTKWELVGTQELHFHDNECDQYPANSNEDKACDNLFRVKIESKNQPTANGECKRKNIGGWCDIGIGKP